jgi:UPF0176 protein
MTFVVAAFYHFFDFPQTAAKRADILAVMNANQIKGSILLAAEGINGTVCGTRAGIDALLHYLKTDITGGEFEHKESFHDAQPFGKAKVRLKKETISLGEAVPLSKRGEYVEAKDWNALIADPDTVIIDTRNSYEVHLGTFERAIDPGTRNFKELPAFARKTLGNAKQKKIATFCTGGIRCEKFTAWLKSEGYEHVYHLRGGILKYLETIAPKDNKFRGECYVFDERIAVGHGLAPSTTASTCLYCGHALKPEDKNHPLYSEGKSCAFCAGQKK